MWTGEQTQSFTMKGLQSAGMSEGWASATDFGIGVLGGGVGGFGRGAGAANVQRTVGGAARVAGREAQMYQMGMRLMETKGAALEANWGAQMDRIWDGGRTMVAMNRSNACNKPMPRTLTKEARGLAPEDRGLTWVAENARMSPEAFAYQSGATGARAGVAPALRYSDRSGLVRFDGLDGRLLIDRKLSFYSTPKARLALDRASMAVRQNPFYSLRIEVPNMVQYKRGMRLLGEQGITNIRIGIVP
jgi:hypothetical protein